MRVLLISHTCQSPTEGQPKVVALSRQEGLELKVVVPCRWRHYGRWRPLELLDDAKPYIEPHKVRWPWAGPAQTYLHHYPGLKRTIKAFKPDVIDLWEEPWGLISVQATRLRDRFVPGAALLSETEQNIDKKLPFPFERFRKHTLSRADWLVGRSTEAVDVVWRKGYSGPATSLPNAVDTELFRMLDRQTCRAQLDLPENARVLGYVGRLVEDKGLADLIQALKLMPSSTHVVMVGRGPAREALESLAREMGVCSRVHWLGVKPLTELPSLMNAFDALLLPSRTTASWKEQFGRVLIESEACGTPAIGSDSGAIADVIGDEARVFTECNPESLALCVNHFFEEGRWDQPGSREELRTRVVNQFSWEAVAAQYVEVYRAALARRRGDAVEPLVSGLPHSLGTEA